MTPFLRLPWRNRPSRSGMLDNVQQCTIILEGFYGAIRGVPTVVMIRRTTTVLLLASYLLLSTGAVEWYHASHGHGALGAKNCQICYILKVATTALGAVVAALLYFATHASEQCSLLETPLIRQDRLRFAAPRAPPISRF